MLHPQADLLLTGTEFSRSQKFLPQSCLPLQQYQQPLSLPTFALCSLDVLQPWKAYVYVQHGQTGMLANTVCKS